MSSHCKDTARLGRVSRKATNDVKRMTLELDREHYAALKAMALEEGRSMHGMMLALIRDAMRRAERRKPQ